MEPQQITIRGAQQHNLKHIDVVIPRNRFVVLTGVSGSGKSSLAFDTIYAEGQRRYVESLSSYIRQFLRQTEKPKVDYIGGLSPAIAIQQKAVSRNPRSTVGTATEVLDYLRVLFARIGELHCPRCGRRVAAQSAQQITNQIRTLARGTRFQILAQLVKQRKGTHRNLLAQLRRDGYLRARIDGEIAGLKLQKAERLLRHRREVILPSAHWGSPSGTSPTKLSSASSTDEKISSSRPMTSSMFLTYPLAAAILRSPPSH